MQQGAEGWEGPCKSCSFHGTPLNEHKLRMPASALQVPTLLSALGSSAAELQGYTCKKHEAPPSCMHAQHLVGAAFSRSKSPAPTPKP